MKNYLFVILLLLLSFTACTKQYTHSVYGRYVPERKDDFAWENGFAAFRMYGPALADENPSNGVDLWLKATPELVVDSFYYREHQLELPYHINYGKGLDCYKVGHTVGCGGLAIVTDSTLWIGKQYTTWQVLEQSSDSLAFQLFYDSVFVDGLYFAETLTITAVAGQVMNRADVVLTPLSTDTLTSTLYLGGGISIHENRHFIIDPNEWGRIIYAEDALSDPTAAQMNYEYNGSTSQGRAYITVYTPNYSMVGCIDNTLISVAKYQPGDTLTYYFGACWSRWTDGKHSFPKDQDWFNYIEQQ